MAYEKRTWVSGEVITAVNLNRIEDALEDTSETAETAEAIAQNSVRTDIEQTLTEAQKATARNNIGAVSQLEIPSNSNAELAGIMTEFDIETNRINTELERQTRRIDTKAETADVAGLAAEIDVKIRQLEDEIADIADDTSSDEEDISDLIDDVGALEERTTAVENKVETKAESAELANVVAFIEREQMRTDDLRTDVDRHDIELKTKAEFSDVSLLAGQLDAKTTEIENALNQNIEDTQAMAESVARHDNEIKTKAEVSEVAMTLVEINHLQNQINDNYDRIKMKAEVSDVLGIAVGVEQHDAQLREHKETLDYLVDHSEAMIGVAAQVDIVDTREADHYDDVLNRMTAKADNAVVGQILTEMVDFDNRIDEKLGSSAHNSEIGQLYLENSLCNMRIDHHDAELRTTRSNEASLSDSVATKISKPSADGTAGQILSTNGDGTTVWTDPVTLDDEIVGDAISDWMSDHPEATTTVQDGSITFAKLNSDLQRALENGSDDFDAQVAANALATVHDPVNIYVTDEDVADENIYQMWKPRIDEYTSYFAETNGYGFIFFTDPHCIDGRSYHNFEYYLKRKMRVLRTFYNRTPAQSLLCGGDWLNGHYTVQNVAMPIRRISKLLDWCAGPYGFTVAGNHDYGYPENLTSLMTQEKLRKMMFHGNSTYYIIEEGDTACYMLDSGAHEYAMTARFWTQVDWFARSLLANTHEHLFGVAHIVLFGVGSGPEYNFQYDDQDWILAAFADNVTQVADAFNKKTSITLNGSTYDFSGATGTFHFLMSGHTHGDMIFTVNNIPVCVTSAYLFDYFDCCFADFNRNMLYTVRIGNSNSRSMPIIPYGQYQIST